MSDYVFPQFNDYDDPQNFAFHLGQSNLGDFVEYGLSLTADHANENFDVTEGKAYVEQTDAIGDASGETRHRLVYAVHVDAIADVGFATTAGVNYVWLDANVGSQDSPQIVVETNDVAPSDASLKLGEIDAGADSAAVETNREPTSTFGPTTITDAKGTSLVDVPETGPVAVTGRDVQLDIGASLVDENGNDRLQFGSNRTHLLDDSGNQILSVRDTGVGVTELEKGVLRIPVDKQIEDSEGDTRLGFHASRTELFDEVGDRVGYFTSTGHKMEIPNEMRWRDMDGNFIAMTYATSASAPGALQMTNAHLEMNSSHDIRPFDTPSYTGSLNLNGHELNDGASAMLFNDNRAAMVFVVDNAGNGGLFLTRGGNAVVDKVLDPTNAFTTTEGNGGTTNVYHSTTNDRYEIENQTGAQETYGVFANKVQ